MPDVAVHTIMVATHGRYLVRVPATPPPYPLLVGFHGYSENAERHLEQLERIPGIEGWLLVAVQGLHRFYAGKTEDVVASWMTRQDRELAIADNVAYVDQTVATVRREHVTTRLVFAGFSQGAAMAFRAASLGAHRADGVIALAGDVPPDVRDRLPSHLPPVLIARGARDQWYTDEKLRTDLDWLRDAGIPAESCVFDAGHEWTDEFRGACAQFLEHVAAGSR